MKVTNSFLLVVVGLVFQFCGHVWTLNQTGPDDLASQILLSLMKQRQNPDDASRRLSESFWAAWEKSYHAVIRMSRINPEISWMSNKFLDKLDTDSGQAFGTLDMADSAEEALRSQIGLINLNAYPAPHPSLQGSKLISQCDLDMLHMIETMATIKYHTKDKMWIIQMLDAMSKLPAGEARGAFRLVGDYGECLQASTKYRWGPFGTPTELNGRYCKILLGPDTPLGIMGLPVGLCLPASCTSEHINDRLDLVTSFLRDIPIIGDKIPNRLMITGDCLPLESERLLDTGGILFLIVIGIILALNAIGTGIDLSELYSDFKPVSSPPVQAVNGDTSIKVSEPEAKPQKKIKRSVPEPVTEEPEGFYGFLSCWSIYRNSQPLFWSYVDSPPPPKAVANNLQRNQQITKQNEDEPLKLNLESLHGIRFGSMLWVMTFHIFLLPLFWSENALDFWEAMDHNWAFQAVVNSTASCDSFFTLSGFLLAYMYFRRSGSGGRTWLHYYVHRFWRLTPVYGVTIWFAVSILYRIGEGPFWDYGNYTFSPRQLCGRNWWTNLLYINNMKTSCSEECLPWTWYLANDMQFYWIAPLFVILLKWKPKLGISATVVAILASAGGTFAISYVNDYWPFMSAVEFKHVASNMSDIRINMISEEFDRLYQAPWVRIGSYLIGLLFGYLMATLPARSFKPLMHPVSVIICWIASLIIMIAVVYGIFRQDKTMTTLSAAFYTSLSRPVWSVALCWVIFATTTGQGGPVTVLLSFSPFGRLTKLSYTCYLIHPLLVELIFLNNKQPYHFTHANAVFYLGGLLMWTHLFAAIIHLAIEQPFHALERWFLRVIQ